MTDKGKGVHNITSMAEYQEALAMDGVMVIDCMAVWCGPCKVIAPIVVEFSSTYPDARFYKVDVDEVPDVAQELAVRAMPTFVIFKDHELAETVVGMNPPALEAAIKKHVA
ncbi:Cytoplasmic thioredoxin isoenzyme 2 [Ptychographa xylographoides]|nr:Cytoplasmic thioredoxin isoenzyme 2 [Ptychographa xylographoides]